MSIQHARKPKVLLGRWVAFVACNLLLLVYGLYTMRMNMGKKEIQEVSGYTAVDPELIEEMDSLAVQSGGRVKPYATWAKFLTYSLHGSSSVKFKASGELEKLNASEVVFQCLFYPDFAAQLELFRIEDKNILSSLDIESDEAQKVLDSKERRDLYSYQELLHFLPSLIKKSDGIYEIERKDWNVEQRQTTNLTDSLLTYINLTSYFNFAREEQIALPNSSKSGAKLSEWMEVFPVFLQSIQLMQEEKGQLSPEVRAIWNRFEKVAQQSKDGIYLMPPVTSSEESWSTMGDDLVLFFQNEFPQKEKLITSVQIWEGIAAALSENDQRTALQFLQKWNATVGESQGDVLSGQIASEVKYTRNNYFFTALVLLFPALLLVLASWIIPSGRTQKVLWCGVMVLTLLSCLYVLTGVTHRCLLMHRPPVGNLFDTIIFIAGLALFVLLIVELLTKRSIALGLAVFLGIILLFLARRYEVGDGKDHLDPLVAVLDSNFWLATHVVTITLGYMGGLVAASLSATYIFGRALRIAHDESDFRRMLNRSVYGMLGFTLLFSLIGTVLGGIWANESWGRFWGWDPKENGALMIVLWCLVVLHARLAGYLREWGIHIFSVLGANVVVFSWWHVNSLSTGLHSYGFIEGINAIWGVYGITTLIAIAGVVTKVVLDKKQNVLSSVTL